MKGKIIGGVVAVIIVAGIAGDPDPGPAPAEASRPEPAADTRPAISDDEVSDIIFVAAVQSGVDSLANAPADIIVELGHTACDTLDAVDPDNGEELALATAGSFGWGQDGHDAMFIFGAASVAYCPRWEWLFDS